MKDRLKRGLLRSAKSPSRSSKSSSMNTKSLPTQISLSTLETMETVSPRPEERLTKSCTDVSTTKADSLTFPPNSPDFMPRRTDSNVQEISDVKKLINIQNSEVRHDDNLHDLRKDSDRLNKEGGLRQDPVIASVSTLPVLPKKKNRIKETITRFFAGMTMLSIFFAIMYSGHIYICGLVALLQVLLFRELVKVRYNTYFHIIDSNIPLFRTTQWIWFLMAIFYTYSDFAVEIIKSNTSLHYLLPYAQHQGTLSFFLYSGVFVLTISTMQIGYIRFQLNQLCWTIVVLCLTVGQLKYIMHNVYNGLIWFVLPVLLVINNDVFAYFSGWFWGRKFIRRPFISLSPNKTWEGFIGGCIFTVINGWYCSRFMAQFKWMACPTNDFTFSPDALDCELDPIFLEANSIFPPQIFEMLPQFLVRFIPGVVNMCSVLREDGMPQKMITACISGEPTHVHHHFELVVKNVLPFQFHALALCLFASLVAPFGGYLASGIKRAYGIKDFDSIIPGHGGIMDRMDCQFLMALYTWVHYNAFVRITTVSVPKMIYTFNLMRESEQVEFYQQVFSMLQERGILTS